MKILIYSDLHLHNHHRLLINSETALNMITHLKDIAVENGINTIVSAGDFFHTKARAYAPHVVQALLRVKDIHKAGLKHYMLIGNHDMVAPNTTMNSILFVFSDYAKIIPDYYFVDYEKTRLHFLSYTSTAFENFILAENKKNILITHLDIIGFTMANGFQAKTGFTKEHFKDFDLVVSGHYHRHQSQGNIVYVGSPYQTNFGEANQPHGYLILDIDDATWEFHESKGAPRYQTYTVSSIEDLEKLEISNNFIKVKLATHDLQKSKLKDALFEKGAISVDIIPPEDLKEIEKYYDQSLGEEPSEIASAYINSLNNIQLEKEKLLKYFTKIEEVATNISDYEI